MSLYEKFWGPNQYPVRVGVVDSRGPALGFAPPEVREALL